jgi:hypothetical protein
MAFGSGPGKLIYRFRRNVYPHGFRCGDERSGPAASRRVFLASRSAPLIANADDSRRETNWTVAAGRP